MRIRLFTGIIAVVALATAASAAPSLEFSLGLCAGKTNAKARLACFDAIVAQLKSRQTSTTAVVPVAPAPVSAPAPVPAAIAAAPQPAPVVVPVAPPPPAAMPVAPEAQFGSEHLSKEARQASAQPEPADTMVSAVKSLSYAPNGRVTVTLENGQVWRQIDGDTAKFRAKEGEKITIERAILGSYNMTAADHTGLVKVRRVQ